MRKKNRLTRRQFIRAACAAAAAGPAISCGRTESRWRFLTTDEARTLEAICDCLIPEDEDPGAVAAGAVNFIDRQLSGCYRRHRQAYRWGIAGVDEVSRARHGKGFAELPLAERNQILAELEKGQVRGERWGKLPATEFFDLVLRHTMQGFYGDPRHGGNRDAVSWRMLGLPYPPVRGRLHYDLTKRERS